MLRVATIFLSLLSCLAPARGETAARAGAGRPVDPLLLENGAVRSGPYHVYLQFLPKEDEEGEAALRRYTRLRANMRALMPAAAPEIEKLALGQKLIRWTAAGWDGPTALAKRLAARALLAGDPHARILFVPAPPPSESTPPTAAETARLLESRTGAVQAYFQEDFGVAFPEQLLSWDGGTVFDNAEHAARAAGMPVAGLLYDAAEGRRRTAAEMVELARGDDAPARRENGVAPPAPLRYDAVVAEVAAASGVDADILRALIYASKGYEGGYPERTGLYGPMGLSRATGEWVGVARADLDDPEASIRGGAEYYKKLSRMFGGDMSRIVAAFHCGAGRVRDSGGIPRACADFLGRYQLAYRNGPGWALSPGEAPKVSPRPPVRPEAPVTPAQSVTRQLRETVVGAVQGMPPTGRRDSFRNVPAGLVRDITREATTGRIRVDPHALIALSEAEGGVNAGTSHAGARGVLQITWETARWECGFTSREQLWDRAKNIDCAERVFKRRLDKAGGDIVLAWALYNTKVKWHDLMLREGRVANIKETVRHVTRASYRYYQLTGTWPLDPNSANFTRYFTSERARAWSREALADVQRWDRNEMGVSATRTVPRQAWRLNSTGTYCYRRDPTGRKRWQLHRVPAQGCLALAI